ncbi:MAG TPA: lysylphosphatidylglycerol synthase domain-containing protein [Actinomycetes bacterium]|nr:lysylphosphatidylglycerol synthase domain-containing protein [Actinomycetes bacterium]
MTDHVPDGGVPRARRSPLRRGLQALVIVVFVGFLAWALAGRWQEVRSVLGELSVAALALATVAMFAGIWCSFLCWKAILADLGSPVQLTGSMRIFYVGQAGKYLPGKLWPILTQTRLGREYRVPARASGAAAAIFMLMVLGTGLLLGACTLPALGEDALGRYWWTLLALPVAAATLWPPLLNRLLAVALRLAHREPMPRPLSLAGVGRAAAWSLAMWVLYGVHLWALLADLGAGGAALPVVAVGAFAASWSIGFLLLVAPAGAGPREAALVLLLGSTVARPSALVAALVSRLIMTVGDLGWSLVAVVVERARRRSGRAGEPPGPPQAPPGPAVAGERPGAVRR